MGKRIRNGLAVGAAISIFSLAGCASSSGVMQVGPDTYTIGASTGGFGLAADAQRQAYADARAYCAQHGGGSVRVQNQADRSDINGANTNITFQCVAP